MLTCSKTFQIAAKKISGVYYC